jgi:hypothetical protein
MIANTRLLCEDYRKTPMRILSSTVFLMCIHVALCAQIYSGPIPAPVMGYGSFGTEAEDSVVFVNPSDSAFISYVYFPKGISTAAPTVFFLGGNGANTPLGYQPFIRLIVSKGFTVVFVPSPTSQPTLTRYSNLLSGFRYAAKKFPQYVDTSRVGFVGHSFGAGASFSIANNLFTSQNWGTSGRFIIAAAQWYSYGITEYELENFPANTFLLSFIFEDDVVCDHRMAIDIYRSIGISAENKDLVNVSSSQDADYAYSADHVAPNSLACYDAIDHYVLFRLTDAMMDFVFRKNPNAKNVALGNGSLSQTGMPAGLNELVVADTITARFAQSRYGYAFSSTRNPRRNNWGDENKLLPSVAIAVYPAQTTDSVIVFGAEGTVYSLTNPLGEEVLYGTLPTGEETIDLSSLAPAIYVLNCAGQQVKIVRQL